VLSITVNSVPTLDRDSGQPTIRTRQWPWPHDPRTCGGPHVNRSWILDSRSKELEASSVSYKVHQHRDGAYVHALCFNQNRSADLMATYYAQRASAGLIIARHPRWSLHFTPTSASWLNAVEGFFAKLTKRRLKRRSVLLDCRTSDRDQPLPRRGQPEPAAIPMDEGPRQKYRRREKRAQSVRFYPPEIPAPQTVNGRQ
jgi:hypothetical protein